MTDFDKEYIKLLKDIVENGQERPSRSGDVISVFGRSMRFDLKKGIPLLTIRKIFTKGVIYELLWFLRGETNIKYLLENGTNIWTDDAYRYYKQKVDRHNAIFHSDHEGKEDTFKNFKHIDCATKDEFRERTLNGQYEEFLNCMCGTVERYRYGDVGDIYGKQWRKYGDTYTDQIQDIVNLLISDPTSRRLVCFAYNPDAIRHVALPPCHVMFQMYTRKLSIKERVNYAMENMVEGVFSNPTKEYLDNLRIPKYGLSCMFTMRSNDFCLGAPSNLFSYGLLTYMIAHVTNMVPDELIYSVGDCHIYKNHMDGVNKMLSEYEKRKDEDTIYPKIVFNRDLYSIDKFQYDDISVVDYKPGDVIKFELNVG